MPPTCLPDGLSLLRELQRSREEAPPARPISADPAAAAADTVAVAPKQLPLPTALAQLPAPAAMAMAPTLAVAPPAAVVPKKPAAAAGAPPILGSSFLQQLRRGGSSGSAGPSPLGSPAELPGLTHAAAALAARGPAKAAPAAKNATGTGGSAIEKQAQPAETRRQAPADGGGFLQLLQRGGSAGAGGKPRPQSAPQSPARTLYAPAGYASVPASPAQQPPPLPPPQGAGLRSQQHFQPQMQLPGGFPHGAPPPPPQHFQHPGQHFPGQPYPKHSYPGQQFSGQPCPGQQSFPGQAFGRPPPPGWYPPPGGFPMGGFPPDAFPMGGFPPDAFPPGGFPSGSAGYNGPSPPGGHFPQRPHFSPLQQQHGGQPRRPQGPRPYALPGAPLTQQPQPPSQHQRQRSGNGGQAAGTPGSSSGSGAALLQLLKSPLAHATPAPAAMVIARQGVTPTTPAANNAAPAGGRKPANRAGSQAGSGGAAAAAAQNPLHTAGASLLQQLQGVSAKPAGEHRRICLMPLRTLCACIARALRNLSGTH